MITSVGFVGIKTERFAETLALFRDVIGAPLARQEGDLASFRLADGSLFEIYGPGDDFHAFFTTGPVVGFRVADFDATRARMVAACVAFIGEPQHDDGLSWQHFRCPDGTVAEIIGPGAPPSPSDTLEAG